MSGAQHGSSGPNKGADATAAGTAAAPDAAGTTPTTGTTPTAGEADSPAPMTSLASLLGGTIEGGATCTTDGTSD